MQNSRNHKIELNEPLVRRVVYAINQAISEDAPNFRRDHHFETNNYAKSLNGDLINENLRIHVIGENIALHNFRRFVWDGRLLIDHEHRATYTITTFATLKTAPLKRNNHPYFLQSLLFSENHECEGFPKQMSLADYGEDAIATPFTAEELEADFDEIMQGVIQRASDYRHYIVAYKAERAEITDIKLLYLDRDFAEVDSISLMEYVTPDFAALTEVEYDENAGEMANTEETPRQLYRLKPGLKPALKSMEDEA